MTAARRKASLERVNFGVAAKGRSLRGPLRRDERHTLMHGWVVWTLVGIFGWLVAALPLGVGVGRAIRIGSAESEGKAELAALSARPLHEAGVTSLSASIPRVLVVDADPSLRLLLRTTMAESHLEVREAGSAEQAASLVASWRPSLVILDVGLPGLDGVSF